MEPAPLNTARYPALDYLRGLMALAVLVFHYDKWIAGYWDAQSLQGRLGVYAVSVFFVLSGLTLTLVYKNRLGNAFSAWAAFFKKRFFRIYPLLWLATAATLCMDDAPRPAQVIVLNFTGLFGFVDPSGDIATGAWSIGCELVFYLFFPVLIGMGKKQAWLFGWAFVVLTGLGAWIAFAWFDPTHPAQADWWSAYVQVPNHAFFFVGGMAIGLFQAPLQRVSINWWRAALLFSVLAFAGWPITHEAFSLVSGWTRIALSFLTLLAVCSYYHCQIRWNGWAHRLAAWLGAISYSLYLLHPLTFRAFKAVVTRAGWELSSWVLFLGPALLALVISHFSYYYLEKPLMRRA